ncbi:AAA ATPase, central region [Lachnospiraceae bacterium KM106-2]|nr:AAA ATPase, central region [Lachnospiraceae bacterium KM106-2]
MEQLSYRNEELLKMAKMNYDILTKYCTCFEDGGYWEKPNEILKQGIIEVLDTYLQSLLYELAIDSNRFHESERRFIIDVVKNPVLIEGTQEIDEESLAKVSKKMKQAPPILLQLSGLYDHENHEKVTCVFFDCILNLLLAFVYLDAKVATLEYKYIQAYYERAARFIDPMAVRQHLNSRYIFKKISDQDIIPDENKFGPTVSEIREEAKVSAEAPTKQEEKDTSEQAMECKSKLALDELLEELDSLIGLKEVKEQVNTLINLIKVRNMRKDYDMPNMDMTFHMVFTGNPGTGKTTVARLIAKIFKELGLLSKGTLTEVDRSSLVAGYVGQTAIKVTEVVNKALGGVLFIDEAYALATHNAGGNDFGTEAIDTLVKMMEDHREDLIVIVAGYKEEMQQFLDANTGLVSRFNKFIEFKDYTSEELLEILNVMANKSGFCLDDKTQEICLAYFKEFNPEKLKKYGNARGVRNSFESMVLKQANRIVTLTDPTKEQLSLITTEDLPDEICT